jgi:hypothetical protein
VTSTSFGEGGAGRESPIFGLTGTTVALAPLMAEPNGSGSRAPFATAGASAAPIGASGTDAGWPVVGSNIREIPS